MGAAAVNDGGGAGRSHDGGRWRNRPGDLRERSTADGEASSKGAVPAELERAQANLDYPRCPDDRAADDGVGSGSAVVDVEIVCADAVAERDVAADGGGG